MVHNIETLYNKHECYKLSLSIQSPINVYLWEINSQKAFV